MLDKRAVFRSNPGMSEAAEHQWEWRDKALALEARTAARERAHFGKNPEKRPRGPKQTLPAEPGDRSGYRISPRRSGQPPVSALGGTTGLLVVDAYYGYHATFMPEKRGRAGCPATNVR